MLKHLVLLFSSIFGLVGFTCSLYAQPTLDISNSSSQNQLIGNWIGEAKQSTGELYYFEIYLDSISPADQKVFGKTYLQTKDANQNIIHALFAFEGKFRSAYRDQLFYLEYNETSILKQQINSDASYWCLTHGKLGISVGRETMVMKGTWDAPSDPSCGSGTIAVYRKLHTRKDPTVEAYQHAFNSIDLITDKQMEIESDSVVIQVWDSYVVDNDTISLFYNGQWILKNHRISQEKKTITLHQLPEEVSIILHAENLGNQPPNTATIELFDGVHRKQFVLNSNKSKSEALTLIQRKRGE